MSLVLAMLLPFLAVTPLMTAGTPVPGSGTIPPIVWQAIAITDSAGATTEIDAPERYTAQFLPEGVILIQADCNRGRLPYTSADGDWTVGVGMLTMAMCPPDSHDHAFVATLSGATSYAFDADGLLVVTGKNGSITMQATLEGVTWQWEQFQGGDESLKAPSDPSRYTVTFLPDARLAVQADCNRATGTWSTLDSQMELKLGAMTRAMCRPGSLSDDFVKDLGFVRSYVFRDGKLHLSLMADAGIMTFTATYDAETAATPAPQATPQG